MAKMQAIVCNEHQDYWDAHLFHVVYAYNNSTSAATGLASNNIHTGRLPRPSLAVFDRSYGEPHQSFDCDHLVYCDVARKRKQRAYEIVHKQHALRVAHVNGGTLPSRAHFSVAFSFWATGPTHHQPCTPPYQQLRVNAGAREIALTKGASREATDSSPTMFIVLASYPLP